MYVWKIQVKQNKFLISHNIVRLNLFNHVLALFHTKFAYNLAIRYLVFK